MKVKDELFTDTEAEKEAERFSECFTERSIEGNWSDQIDNMVEKIERDIEIFFGDKNEPF